jgi:prepilin-type processing-associated H-X9-DG protein
MKYVGLTDPAPKRTKIWSGYWWVSMLKGGVEMGGAKVPENAYFCPFAPGSQTEYGAWNSDGSAYCFAMNQPNRAGTWNNAYKYDLMPNPSMHGLIIDGWRAQLVPGFVAYMKIYMPISPRHPNSTANVLFFDFHVKTISEHESEDPNLWVDQE